MKWIYIAIGGGLGSVFRFALSTWLMGYFRLFPMATLFANLLAAALIGVLAAQRRESEVIWYFLVAGFCGGLSTFSTFSLETVQLMRSGHFFIAIANVLISVMLCLSIVYFLGPDVKE